MPEDKDRRRELSSDPFSVLRAEMDRVFEDVGRVAGGTGRGPRFDIAETDSAIEIDADLPGWSDEEVEITVEGRTLVIRGEKRQDDTPDRRTYHVRERNAASFTRRIDLPFTPEPEQVTAGFEHGVLKIEAQKPPREEPSKVKIRAAATRNAPPDRPAAQSRSSGVSSREASPKSATAGEDETSN